MAECAAVRLFTVGNVRAVGIKKTLQIVFYIALHILRRINLRKFQPMLRAVFPPEFVPELLPQNHARQLILNCGVVAIQRDPSGLAIFVDIRAHLRELLVVFPLCCKLRVDLLLRHGKPEALGLVEHDEVHEQLIDRVSVADLLPAGEGGLVLLFVVYKALRISVSR